MLRSILGPCSLRGRPSGERISVGLARGIATAVLAAMLTASPALARAEDGRPRLAIGSSSGTGDADARATRADRAGRPRNSGAAWLGSGLGGNRWPGSESGWSSMACLGLVLAVCGGIAVAARRLGPRGAAEAMQVVGRVNLSPKHTVYLLRVGRRVLVVGAGPQGPPALITELDDVPQGPPAPQQGDGS